MASLRRSSMSSCESDFFPLYALVKYACSSRQAFILSSRIIWSFFIVTIKVIPGLMPSDWRIEAGIMTRPLGSILVVADSVCFVIFVLYDKIEKSVNRPLTIFINLLRIIEQLGDGIALRGDK